MPQGDFVWYELMTPDTAAAQDFYGQVVGWSAETSAMADFDYTLFKMGEARMAGLMVLGEEAKKRGVPPCWTGYLGADDVDAMAESFKAAGGAIHHGPQDIPGIGRFAVVADPQGAVLCLFRGEGEAPPPLDRNAPGKPSWHELYTPDPEAAFAFYSDRFGWTKGAAMPMPGDSGAYQLFAQKGQDIGGMMKLPTGLPVPFWGYYFNVPDIKAALAKATELGARVLNGPMDVPGGSVVAQLMDPQGAAFNLVQP